MREAVDRHYITRDSVSPGDVHILPVQSVLNVPLVGRRRPSQRRCQGSAVIATDSSSLTATYDRGWNPLLERSRRSFSGVTDQPRGRSLLARKTNRTFACCGRSL